MDADKSNKPAQTPGLKPPDPWKMAKSKWPHSNCQKTGGTAAQWKKYPQKRIVKKILIVSKI
jgi:hypothetical protein